MNPEVFHRRGSLALGLAGVLVLVGCGPKPPEADPSTNAASGSPVTAPLDYLAAQGRAKQVAIKVTSMAEVTQAVQRFHALEDRYPRDLEELVRERYLSSLPPSPRGSRLAYSPQTGEVKFVPAAP